MAGFHGMNDSRTIWVLPGGRFQVPLIEAARERGLRVVCSDRDADCEGAGVADEFVRLGVDEREALLSALQERRPDAVATDQTDSGVATVAWLAEQLGLPGIGVECAAVFTNKRRMRKVMGGPEFAVCNSLKDAEELGWPLVLKPEVGQSSRGVHRVDGAGDFAAAFDDAGAHGQVLAERWVDGPEFTVEGWMNDGRHHSLAISIKSHYAHRPTVANTLVYTPAHAEFDYEALRKQNDRLVERSGLPFGLTHAEYRFADGKFWLMEIAARGCGSLVASHIVPEVSGVDIYGHYLGAVLGEARTDVQSLEKPKCAVLEFLDFKPGRVCSIDGLQELLGMEKILSAKMNYGPGEVIPKPVDDTSRAGYFIAVTDTAEELEALRARARDCLKVFYDE